MKLLKFLSFSILAFSLILFTSCNDDDNSSRGTSTISVKLVDDPGDYDHVYVEVIDVLVRYDDADGIESDDIFGDDDYSDDEMDGEEGAWVSLNAFANNPVDLLELTGGVELLLVDNLEIPAGRISQMRLVLGEDNTIVIDGVPHELKTPSGQQSGLKIKVDTDLEANFGYTFILDFDVDESVVIAGNSGNINLKPVMRAEIEAFTGAISGEIDVVGLDAEVSATLDGLGFITTNVNPDDGKFVIPGVRPGIYTVIITPAADSGLDPIEVLDVEVTIANIADVGIIDIDPND